MAFWALSDEPAVKTRVVSNGTEALPLLIDRVAARGGLEHEGLLRDGAGDRIALGVPGRATTTTGPRIGELRGGVQRRAVEPAVAVAVV